MPEPHYYTLVEDLDAPASRVTHLNYDQQNTVFCVMSDVRALESLLHTLYWPGRSQCLLERQTTQKLKTLYNRHSTYAAFNTERDLAFNRALSAWAALYSIRIPNQNVVKDNETSVAYVQLRTWSAADTVTEKTQFWVIQHPVFGYYIEPMLGTVLPFTQTLTDAKRYPVTEYPTKESAYRQFKEDSAGQMLLSIQVLCVPARTTLTAKYVLEPVINVYHETRGHQIA